MRLRLKHLIHGHRQMRDDHADWHARMHERLHEHILAHGRRGPHGGGRRQRLFDAGELRLVLLHLMEAQPRHGYDLIREIEARTGGAYAPSPGVVYPTLTMLDEQELIQEAAADGAKRAYALSDAGKAELETHRAEAEAALARLDALRAESGQTEAGPVWRAMQNLRTVLVQRLAGTQDKQALFAAADIIDEAARRIERL